MTVPFERTRALIMTRLFLQRLQEPGETPHVPRWVRGHAAFPLRHYPTYADMEQAHKALPDTFGPVPPYSALSDSADVQSVIAAAAGVDTAVDGTLAEARYRNASADLTLDRHRRQDLRSLALNEAAVRVEMRCGHLYEWSC